MIAEAATIAQNAALEVNSAFNLGNALWNAIGFITLLYFIKLWMKNSADKVEELREAGSKGLDELKSELRTFCTLNTNEHRRLFERTENHSVRIAVVEDRAGIKNSIRYPSPTMSDEWNRREDDRNEKEGTQ